MALRGISNPRISSSQLRSMASASGNSATKSYSALLVDVGGTLLETARPVGEIYASFGAKYGVQADAKAIKNGFKKAFAEPWPERLRYDGDGRRFWKHAVATATGCDSNAYFEDLYQHFAKGEAWKLADGAEEALMQLRSAGVKLAVVSNFDSRLRSLLHQLNLSNLFDSVIISSEIGYEKPAKEIFIAALNGLDVKAGDAVHVGDDPVADKQGANAVGINSWLWKKEVNSFDEIVAKILSCNKET